jgi:hypothetical protein
MIYVPRFISVRKTTANRILMAALCVALILISPSLTRGQDDPPPEAGRISYIQGSASVQPAGIDDWGQAEVNMPLGAGDRIVTEGQSRAEIQIGRTYIRMGVGTDISIIDVTSDGVSIGVAQGRIHLHCFGLWPGQSLHVNTASGSATLNSPGEMRVDVYPDQQAALFTQYANNAFVSGAGGFSSQLPEGNALELVGTNPVVPQWMQVSEPEGIDILSRQRDRQIESSMSYRYVSSDIGGAYELDANGDWLPQSPYGAIWFPHVDQGWAPYHNGHWVNHAPWGSVWVEQEPWGYAPFHYGRWVVFNGRWGWVPGPVEAHPVWSPALVVFAGGINNGGGRVSAWFPLGPGEPYRPWYPCSPRYVDQVNISNLRPAPGIRIHASYAGFNFGAVAFANRSSGFSAMRQEDFAAGRPVRENTVVINRTVINNITIINRPPVEVNAHVFRPPMRPVPVAAARPAFVNEHGMVVSARVGFKPAPPPVRAAPPVQALPGHKLITPPAGVKMTAPGNAAGAPGRPAQQPTQVTPAGKPVVNGAGNVNQREPSQGAQNQDGQNRGGQNQGGQGPHPNSARPPELTAKPGPAPKPVVEPIAKPVPPAPPKPAPAPKAVVEPIPKPAAPAPKAEGQQGPKSAANPPAKAAETTPGQNQKPGAKPADKNKEGDKNKPRRDDSDNKNN